ncbi:hypothetical protein AJ80_08999 [Polytolypa hystricis UAMH7299]|uniref:Uncharacterized protein n=1 Tax=Polytolypa hystricis (strain UAMH7299) TaxID=1447883 RepID=A0A2B7WXF9_POLH7|nr:hypothetical protein AJ80_08999 [Polytolypa hystricis UAMH7299]
MTDIIDIPTLPDDVELEDIKSAIARMGTLSNQVLQHLTALKGAADLPDMVFNRSEDFTSFRYSEMEADEIFNEKLGGWCKQGIDDEAIENRSSKINNWIDTQQIQPQII